MSTDKPSRRATTSSGQVTGSKLGITIVVMLAALMAVIDISIVSVALTDIRASFGTPIDQIGWVSTGYMMANIMVIPMTGWLQRRFGYRRTFVTSIVVFIAASALCGTAWNLPSLVIFRVFQGFGGGVIIPTAQSLLLARYKPSEHGLAAGLFGLGAITGPLLGPTVGGYLIDWASWHWIFLVNVPFGIIAAVIGAATISEPDFVPDRTRVDYMGIVLLAITMPSLQFVLEEGNREGWFESRTIVFLATVAAIGLITFIVHELETSNPVVELRVFRNRTYAAGTGVNFIAGVALFSSTYLLSLFCGTVLSYSALDIGHVFLLAGLVQIVVMPLVGKKASNADPRLFLFVGIVMLAVSQWMAAGFTNQTGFWDIVEPQLIRAVALAFVFVPMSVAALSDLPAEQRGNATGLFALTRELGGSLGTAWMSKAMADGIAEHGSRLAESVTLYDAAVYEQATQIAAHGLRPEIVLFHKVQSQAVVLTFEAGFRLTTVAIICGLVLVALLRRVPPGTQLTAGAH